MKIFAHRGLWSSIKEQNSIASVKNALLKGFDVEIDLRYQDGQFLISHDDIDSSKKYVHLKDMLKVIKNYPERKFAIHFKYNDWEECEPKIISSVLDGYKNQIFLFDMSLDYCEK